MTTPISRAGVTTARTLTRSIPQSRGKKYLTTVFTALVRAARATNSMKTLANGVRTLRGRISRSILRKILFKILTPTRQMPQSGPSTQLSIVSRPSPSILPCFVEPEFIPPFLDAQDLSSLLSVNKEARNAVLKSPENLAVLLSGRRKAECIKKIKEEIIPLCSDFDKAQILGEIVKTQLRHNNLEAAKITAGLIPDPNQQGLAFVEIVKVKAGRDLEAAKITAGQIQDTYWRGLALVEIAKAEVGRHDLEAAKITAGQIQDTNWRDQTLVEIAKAEVGRHDLEAARITAKQIQDINLRRPVSCEIVKANLVRVAGYDLEFAKTKAGLIQDPDLQGQVFVAIVKACIEHDLEAAKTTAGLIQDSGWQGKAFFEIAKAEVGRHDLEAAKITAGQIQETQLRSQAFVEIVKAYIEHDLEVAKTTAGQIQETQLRSQVFVEIVKAEAGHDLEAAKTTAGHIQDTYYQMKAFLEIAKIDPTHDIEAVKNGMESITTGAMMMGLYIDLFAELIKIEAMHNPVVARATIDLPRDPLWQVEVLITILRNEVSCSRPEHDLAAAKMAAERIGNEGNKAWAFGAIAKVEAKYNWEAACATAELIEDPSVKARTLLALCANA